MTAPRIAVEEVTGFEWPFTLRIPFRFGAVTLRSGRQAVVAVRVRLADGATAEGLAAETLAPKWFDKNPLLSDEQNEHQLRRAIEIARDVYLASPPATPFGLFAEAYGSVQERASAEGLPPLVAAFGQALVDRAVLDAVLRQAGLSFFSGMRANVAGLASHPVISDLAGFDWNRFLASLQPRNQVFLRHTVGLLDPITAADRDPATAPQDGLPVTLEEVCAVHRPRFFKLKVSGDLAADLDRLRRIVSVLERHAPGFRVTLDGNEQFGDAAAALAFLDALAGDAALAALRAAVLYLEQPIRRDRALAGDVHALARHFPLMIDESDGTLDAFVSARRCGYAGVSSKACKGIYRSLINLARVQLWNAAQPKTRHFLSGEDLTCLAGLAVQQDLALVALLGLEHVERNGHHFVDGFSGRPEAEAARFLAAHPDLYRRAPRGARLAIVDGAIRLASLDCPGLGAAARPDLAAMAPMPKAAWPPAATSPAGALSSP
ncbi:MAG: mandelate racemase [Elioraea sp.]|nr:mandelate racemase [Elioraea sp.]